MVHNLEEVILGQEAHDYLKRFLRRGNRQLSKSLGENIDPDSGRIRTFLPSTVTAEAARQFEFGGKLPQPIGSITAYGSRIVPIPNLDDILIASIQTHLGRSDSSFCVFENGGLRPDYPAVNRLPNLHTFMCEDTVCHYLTASDAGNIDFIRLTIRASRSAGPPYLVGCAGNLPAASPLRSEKVVSKTELDDVARSVQDLFIGAYDGEGFLIWTMTKA